MRTYFWLSSIALFGSFLVFEQMLANMNTGRHLGAAVLGSTALLVVSALGVNWVVALFLWLEPAHRKVALAVGAACAVVAAAVYGFGWLRERAAGRRQRAVEDRVAAQALALRALTDEELAGRIDAATKYEETWMLDNETQNRVMDCRASSRLLDAAMGLRERVPQGTAFSLVPTIRPLPASGAAGDVRSPRALSRSPRASRIPRRPA